MEKLEEMEIVLLTNNQMKTYRGGISIGLALAIAGAAIYVYNNYGDFVSGFSDGVSAAKRN